MNPAEILVY